MGWGWRGNRCIIRDFMGLVKISLSNCLLHCSDVSLPETMAIREGLVLLLIVGYERMLLRAFPEWLLIGFCRIPISCMAPLNIIISDKSALAFIVGISFSNVRRDGNWVAITLLVKPFVKRVGVNGFQVFLVGFFVYVVLIVGFALLVQKK